MALLYGRAGRLTYKNGGFRPGQDIGALHGVRSELELAVVRALPPSSSICLATTFDALSWGVGACHY
jgi:hypothetical protein